MLGCSGNPAGPDPEEDPPEQKSLPWIDYLKSQIGVLANSMNGEAEACLGKRLLRPITVTGLTRTEYMTNYYERSNSTDARSALERERINRTLVYEGFLMPGDDYFSDRDSVFTNNVSGFYVPGTDSIYIIIADTAISIPSYFRYTLFHEYVHAIQDQYYNLTTIYKKRIQLTDNVVFSDSYYATNYLVEGEAEYAAILQQYKDAVGTYPTSFYSISAYLSDYKGFLDSLVLADHASGVRYISTLPFYWAYAYGPPAFKQMIDNNQWQRADSLFAHPPIKSREILNVDNYLAPSRENYMIEFSSFVDTLFLTRTVFDYDELGQIMTITLLREWGITDYFSLTQNLVSDRLVVAGNAEADTLSLYWYSYWQDSLSAARFAEAYVSIFEQKRNVVVIDSGVCFGLSDEITFHMEQSGNALIIMEGFPSEAGERYLSILKDLSVVAWPAGAAKAGRNMATPATCIDKGQRRGFLPRVPIR